MNPHNHIPQPARGRSAAARVCSRGFTLLELLVVMGIMLLVAGVCIPAFKKILSGNGLVQAQNEISGFVSTAHALAMRTHGEVALVFYYVNPDQMAMQLAVPEDDFGTGNQQAVTPFVLYQNRNAVDLPHDAGVASLNYTGGNNGNALPVVVVFDQNGHMLVRTGIYAGTPQPTPVTATSPPYTPTAWSLPSTGTGATSTPGLMIYSLNGYTNAVQTPPPGQTSSTAGPTYIQQNSSVLVINSYTGTVDRQQGGS